MQLQGLQNDLLNSQTFQAIQAGSQKNVSLPGNYCTHFVRIKVPRGPLEGQHFGSL